MDGQVAPPAVYRRYSVPVKRFLEKQKTRFHWDLTDRVNGQIKWKCWDISFKTQNPMLASEWHLPHTHTFAVREWAGTIQYLTHCIFVFVPQEDKKIKELPRRPLGCLETPGKQVRDSRETEGLTLTSSGEAAEAALLPDSGEQTPEWPRLSQFPLNFQLYHS